MKPNLNRIITGFLLLAILTSSAAYFFTSEKKSEQLDEQPTVAKVENKPLSGKAFIEAIPEEDPGFLALDDTTEAGSTSTDLTALLPSVKISSSSNLTTAIAQQIAYKLVKLNPQGPDPKNIENLVTPDMDTIMAQVGATGIIKTAQLPQWDTEASLQPLTVIQKPTKKDIIDYSTSFNTLYQKYIIDSDLVDVIKTSAADPGTLLPAFQEFQDKLEAMPVPQPLIGMHWSFLRVVLYEKNMLKLASGEQDDPVKTTLVLNAKDTDFQMALAVFQNEIKNVNALQGLSLFSQPPLSFKEKFLSAIGIHTARAQWVVTDPALTAVTGSNWLVELGNWIKEWAAQKAKEYMIKTIVQQTVTWINSDFKGAPQFVTNWKQFLGDTANVVAGQAIQAVLPGLCKPFALQIKLQLEAVNLTNPPAVTCTLENVVSNIKNFYADFSQGGWLAYSMTILPGGNYFGQLGTALTTVTNKAQTAKEDAKTKVASGQGYTSSEKCTTWKDYCPTYEDCYWNTQESDIEGSGQTVEEYCTGVAGCPPKPFKQYCADHDVTTPGTTIGDSTNKSLSSQIDVIVNSNDVGAITSALANAALGKLINLGKKGLSSLFAPATPGSTAPAVTGFKPPSDATSTIAGFYTDTTSAQQKQVLCQGKTGNDLLYCMGGTPTVSCSVNGVGSLGQNGVPGSTIHTEGTIIQNSIGGSAPVAPAPTPAAANGISNAYTLPGDPGGGGGGPITINVDPIDATTSAGTRVPGVTCKTTVSGVTTGGDNGDDGQCGHCGGGCNCNTSCTPIAEDNFCFGNDLVAAQAAVFADCAAGIDVGLTSECSDRAHVTDTNGEKYSAALKAKIDAMPGLNATVGEEMGITGQCSQAYCGTGACVEAGPRLENYKIVNSDHSLHRYDPKAICIVGAE